MIFIVSDCKKKKRKTLSYEFNPVGLWEAMGKESRERQQGQATSSYCLLLWFERGRLCTVACSVREVRGCTVLCVLCLPQPRPPFIFRQLGSTEVASGMEHDKINNKHVQLNRCKGRLLYFRPMAAQTSAYPPLPTCIATKCQLDSKRILTDHNEAAPPFLPHHPAPSSRKTAGLPIFASTHLAQCLLPEAELVQGLVIGGLVPPEPLPDTGHVPRKKLLNILDVVQVLGQRVVFVDSDHL